jgi:hypothetical protein
MNVNVILFKVLDITRLSMAEQLQALFQKFDLMHCVVVFVKDESKNLIFMVVALHFIFYCHPLKLQ